jgi:hypothetical protein
MDDRNINGNRRRLPALGIGRNGRIVHDQNVLPAIVPRLQPVERLPPRIAVNVRPVFGVPPEQDGGNLQAQIPPLHMVERVRIEQAPVGSPLFYYQATCSSS